MKKGSGKLPYELTLSGHAGYGPPGSDPVCAGVSTLFYTALAMSKQWEEQQGLWAPPAVEALPGKGGLSLCPRPRYAPQVETLWEVLATGFSLLAEYFPRYVKVEEYCV